MTLGEEAESIRAFRTRCPLHQEVGSCVLELGPIERWALALRVRKAEEAGSSALGFGDDDNEDGDDRLLGMEAMAVVAPWYANDNENDAECSGA
uniref:Uncharacterized protein n=1 Tax=Oryza sativa subsp. japonica TaxID=39947 RepID=Q5Z5G6_ORYSJ|nr:hypothetical protein [Oryza sativa Japonica Group]BAD54603.1 hypothetical protein [Oryza sativa Japonica Group]